MKMIRLIAALAALLVAGVVHASEVTVCWTPPNTNVNGTPLTNLAGFRVYYTSGLNAYDHTIEVNNPGLRCYVVTNLEAATWRFVVTAYNSDGRESEFSNITIRDLAPPPPPPVTPAAPGAAIIAVNRVVYTIKQTADNIALVPVGNVPATTACVAANGVLANGKFYYRVPVAAVTWLGSVRSVVVVADCQ